MSSKAYILTPWTRKLLQQIADFFRDQQQTYLVGGSVRNLLLHEPCSDWDIAASGNVAQQARQLANQLGGYYAHMHDKASRITVKHDQQAYIIDVAPLHGGSIESDVQQRDFTMNAIASPLVGAVQSLTSGAPLPLIDPLHGNADLATRTLRAVSDSIFQSDPLRMLRAVRFSMSYQLTIESGTAHMLTRDASLLTQAAPERIHDELYAILRPDGATARLRYLDAHELLITLIPEFIAARGMPQPDLHHWDVLEHSLETVSALERLATTLQQAPIEIQQSPLENSAQADLAEIQALLHEAEQQTIFHFATLTSAPLKMAALLHDIGKTITYAVDTAGNITFYHHPQAGVPLAQQVMQRISASTQDRRLVQQVVAHHMRPGQLSNDTVTERAIRRYFVDLGPTGIYVALVSLADHLAMRGPESLTAAWYRHLALVRLLLTRYIRERERIIPPRLIQPEELMRRLNIAPGPLIGQLLETIAEAQTEGKVHSKEDALWLAEEIINNVSSGNSLPQR